MEHRKHPRYPAGVEATLEHRWLGHVRGRIRDVSADGIFVALAPTADLHPIATSLSRSPITLRYRLPAGPAGRPCVWRGHIARIGESGVGATTTGPGAGGDPNLVRLVAYARRGEARRRALRPSPDAHTG